MFTVRKDRACRELRRRSDSARLLGSCKQQRRVEAHWHRLNKVGHLLPRLVQKKNNSAFVCYAYKVQIHKNSSVAFHPITSFHFSGNNCRGSPQREVAQEKLNTPSLHAVTHVKTGSQTKVTEAEASPPWSCHAPVLNTPSSSQLLSLTSVAPVREWRSNQQSAASLLPWLNHCSSCCEPTASAD